MTKKGILWLVVIFFILFFFSEPRAEVIGTLRHDGFDVALESSVYRPSEKILSDVVAIEAGVFYSCALKKDRTVWCWGENTDGQLGDGTTEHRTVPIPVKGITDVTAIALGAGHTIALKSDGTVWAWGYNADGQLGDGTTTNSMIPQQVKDLSGIILVAAGSLHSLALRNDGTVWGWGQNKYGQLGDGTTINSARPLRVTGISDVVALSPGMNLTVVLKNDGSVWAWGAAVELYDEESRISSIMNLTYDGFTPTKVKGLSSVIAVGTSDETIALKKDGTVWALDNYHYVFQTVSEKSTPVISAPVQVKGLSGIILVAAELGHTLALKSDGTVWAWGTNIVGQLGDGTTNKRTTPAQVIGLFDVVSVKTGRGHSLALKKDGTVWSWGHNHLGQLGDGTTTQRNTPVPVRTGISLIK